MQVSYRVMLCIGLFVFGMHMMHADQIMVHVRNLLRIPVTITPVCRKGGVGRLEVTVYIKNIGKQKCFLDVEHAAELLSMEQATLQLESAQNYFSLEVHAMCEGREFSRYIALKDGIVFDQGPGEDEELDETMQGLGWYDMNPIISLESGKLVVVLRPKEESVE